MGQRIQELEEALRDFQASTSKEPHPLLRQELLVIKYPSGMSLPSTQNPDNTSMELSDALGTLTIGDHGDVKYFGHSAGTEVRFTTFRRPSFDHIILELVVGKFFS